MGDLATLPPAAARLDGDPAPKGSGLSTESPAGSRGILTSPRLRSASNSEPPLGRGSAMFSTDLGRRAIRKLQGPLYPSAIVRSDIVRDVVTAASYWRSKYPYQYLCIFPQAGWQIGDLWDEQDIHRETEHFCKELLQFIERDNCVRAQHYAHDWSHLHLDRLPVVGGDMTALYNKQQPLSIVDQIFVNEEKRQYPPIFLWHTARIMRTAMSTVRDAKLSIKEPNSSKHSEMENKKTSRPGVTSSSDADAATSHTTMISSSHVITPATSTSGQQSMPTGTSSYLSPPIVSDTLTAQGHFAEPFASGSHAQLVGQMVPSLARSQLGGPSTAYSGLHIPRNRPARSASGIHNQATPSGFYLENMPHASPVHHSRQRFEHISMSQSPRAVQTHMAMNQPMADVHQGVTPFAFEQGLMAPGMIAPQPYANAVPPRMLPSQAGHGALMPQGYSRNSSGQMCPQNATPLLGDMTNIQYSTAMPLQNFDPRRPGTRRISQQHVNTSALYDPYEGSNPSFRAVGYSGGKKSMQNGLHTSSGRQRKISFPSSRPHNGQYTKVRSGSLHMSGNNFFGPKPHREDDRAITQDQECGCYVDWIGPHNDTVNELFVKDLPDNIQVTELEALFLGRLGIKPISVEIKSAEHVQHAKGRKHAFVGFWDTTVAKEALLIRNPTVRGLPVSITVPKRFFQKTVDREPRDTIRSGASPYSRHTSNPNNRECRNRLPSLGSDATTGTAVSGDNLSYSPQDARSDLSKKKKGKQVQQSESAKGSPEARKAKSKQRQEPSRKEKLVETTRTDQDEVLTKGVKAENHALNPGQRAPTTLDTRIEKSATNNTASQDNGKKEKLLAAKGWHLHEGSQCSESSPNKKQQRPVYSQRIGLQPQSETECEIESMKKQSATKQSVKAETIADLVSTTPSTAGGIACGGEKLENDTSFESAAESHSDEEMEAESRLGSESANENVTAGHKTTASAGTESSTAPTLATIDEPERVTAISKDTLKPSALESDPVSSEERAKSTSRTTSQAIDVPKAKQQDISVDTTIATIFEPAKKAGCQRTESLHPFSKASKAQMKKEREQKRKAQKKEKELLAEKVRIAKAAASKCIAKNSTVENGGSANLNGDTEKQRPSNGHDVAMVERPKNEEAISSTDRDFSASTQVSTANSSTRKSAFDADISKRGSSIRDKSTRHKSDESRSTFTDKAAMAHDQSEENGKQIGGSISISNQTGSVTNKEVKPDLPEDCMVVDARSSEQGIANDASRSMSESGSTLSEADEPVVLPKQKKKNTKKKKAAPRTRPDLDFRPQSPNPPWMGPIDTATDVQNYEKIMNDAYGEEEDSDFSWSDLPKMSDFEGKEQCELEEMDADRDNDRVVDETDRGVIVTHAQRAATQSYTWHDTAKVYYNAEVVPKSAARQGEASAESMAICEVNVAATDGEHMMTGVNQAMTEMQRTQLLDTEKRLDVVNSKLQSRKKKKPNNRKNKKKKKKKAAENGESVEPFNKGVNAESSGIVGQASQEAIEDQIDSDDPFFDQLKGIEAIKRRNSRAKAHDSDRQGNAEVSGPVVEVQMMRAMEAYFKETGRAHSNGS